MNETKAQIFKSIFRLDFPLSYKLVDKLGECLELMVQESKKGPFQNTKANINTPTHSIRAEGNWENDKNYFVFGLNLKILDLAMEYSAGLDANKIPKLPTISMINNLIKKLISFETKQYDRIGFRSLFLIEHPKFTFDNIRDRIWDRYSFLNETFVKNILHRDDIGLVFDTNTNNPNEHIRIAMGPYRKIEREKYFSVENGVEEGLIIDIDISQTKLKFEEANFENQFKNYQKQFSSIIEDLSTNLLKDMK